MNSKIISTIIAFGGILGALWIGSSVAQSEWMNLSLLLGGVMILVFLSGGYKYSFHIVTFLVLLAGRFYAGFAIGRDELFLVLTGALVAATFWKARAQDFQATDIRHWSFALTKICLLTWISYVALHMALHVLLFPTAGLSNILKSYNATLMPYVFLLYFSFRREMFPVPKTYLQSFSWIVALVTFGSVVMRIYQAQYGAVLEADNPDDVGMAGPLIINFLRFSENVYSLRFLGPVCLVLGAILFTSRAPGLRSGFWKLFGCGLVSLSLIGGLYSGGRSSIIVSLGLGCLVFLIRGKRGPLALGFVFTACVLVTANLFSDWINTRAPMQLARSAQLILLEKDAQTANSISGSTEWRWGLAKYAFREWQREPKTIILGIGFQGITMEDIAAANSQLGMNEDFTWSMGVKRVATHNLFTDLLVAYGLIGAIIYYLLLVALMALTLHLYRRLSSDSPHKDFALFVLLNLWTSAILGNVSGSFLPIPMLLFLIISLAATAQWPSTPKRVNQSLPESV